MILCDKIKISQMEYDEYIIENGYDNSYIKMGRREAEFLSSFSKEYKGINDVNYTKEEEAYLTKMFLELKLIRDENNSFEEKKSFLSSLKRLDISKIKLYKFNPDNMFDRISNVTNMLISKPAFIVYLLIMLIGFATVVNNSMEIVGVAKNFINEMSIKSTIILYVLIFTTTAIHEFFHGMACKKYTGQVNEIGIMLFYFQPAMYCNVSSVYLLKDKRKKLIVFSVGVLSQLLLSSIAILAYFLVARFGYKPSVLIYYAISNIAIAIYNLIPFIKLDGYWILSTLVGIQNFREKSIDMVLAFIFRKNIKENHVNKKVIMSSYGILALIFTGVLWVTIFLQLKNYTSTMNNEVFRMVPGTFAGIVAYHLVRTMQQKKKSFNMKVVN